jgi:hypothetical protein
MPYLTRFGADTTKPIAASATAPADPPPVNPKPVGTAKP